MSRVYNFSAGPAVLPEEVLRQASEEMMDYRGCGMSVMEMSHRSSVFQGILDEAEADLRDLLQIPDNYKVMFLNGSAHHQFAAVCMNLMKNRKADYIITGQWSKRAFQEGKKYGEAVALASSEDRTFSYIPDCSDLPVDDDADFVYICENNTIYGTKFRKLPNTKGKLLVADVSSCFLSEPMEVEKYGVIYGGVQKNIGPAGMTINIVREDLITDDVLDCTPTVMKAINEKKAALLYDYLDSSRLFRGTVAKEDRSLMNVPFVTGDKEKDAAFIAKAEKAGFVNLKGHRSVGGMRASIYNAMPVEGVEKLVDFMKAYEAENI